MSDASGTTIYNYDGRNRLTGKQTPFGTLSYTYDDAGNLLTTRSSNTNGRSVGDAGDGVYRTLTQVQGNVNGRKSIGEWIVDASYDLSPE